METDYITIWQTFIKFKLYEQLKLAGKTQPRHFQGQRGVFRFDPLGLTLRNFSLQGLQKNVPALDFSELTAHDIVVLSQQPLLLFDDPGQGTLTDDDCHSKIVQAVAKANP